MKLNKPHIWFFLIAFTIVLIGFFCFNSNHVLDINVHDTYYIVAYRDVSILMALIFFLIGSIYFLLNIFQIKLKSLFVKVHLSISISSIMALIIASSVIHSEVQNLSFPLFDDLSYYLVFCTLIFLILIITQIFFIVFSLIKIFISFINQLQK